MSTSETSSDSSIADSVDWTSIEASGLPGTGNWGQPASDISACLLSLRARVERLEAAKHGDSLGTVPILESLKVELPGDPSDDPEIFADAARFRWLLGGRGTYMAEWNLCVRRDCDAEEKARARDLIDEQMAQTGLDPYARIFTAAKVRPVAVLGTSSPLETVLVNEVAQAIADAATPGGSALNWTHEARSAILAVSRWVLRAAGIPADGCWSSVAQALNSQVK